MVTTPQSPLFHLVHCVCAVFAARFVNHKLQSSQSLNWNVNFTVELCLSLWQSEWVRDLIQNEKIWNCWFNVAAATNDFNRTIPTNTLSPSAPTSSPPPSHLPQSQLIWRTRCVHLIKPLRFQGRKIDLAQRSTALYDTLKAPQFKRNVRSLHSECPPLTLPLSIQSERTAKRQEIIRTQSIIDDNFYANFVLFIGKRHLDEYEWPLAFGSYCQVNNGCVQWP